MFIKNFTYLKIYTLIRTMKDNIIEFLYPKNTKPILENTFPIKQFKYTKLV